jgi:hypothetical protein
MRPVSSPLLRRDGFPDDVGTSHFSSSSQLMTSCIGGATAAPVTVLCPAASIPEE